MSQLNLKKRIPTETALSTTNYYHIMDQDLTKKTLEGCHFHWWQSTQSSRQLVSRKSIDDNFDGSQKSHEIRTKQVSKGFHMKKSLSGVVVTLVNMDLIMGGIDTELKIGCVWLIRLKILSHFDGKSWYLIKWIRTAGADDGPGNPGIGLRRN